MTAPTNAEQALACLDTLGPLASVGLRFSVLAPGPAGDPQAHRVTLSQGARDDLAEIAERTRTSMRQATLLGYEPAGTIPASHAMYVPESAAATLTPTQAVVDSGDAGAFDAGAEYARNASTVAARFSNRSGQSATFYRVGESLLQFSKKKLLGLVFRGGEYHRLEPADVLLMKSSFDVLVVGGFAFFTLKSSFERAFGFLDELQRTSADTFDRVTASLRIQGVEALRAAATTNPQMMAKMASIKRSLDDDPGYAESMTMRRLVRFVQAHPDLGIDVSGSGAAQSLVFDPSPAKRFRILNLLNDDYLKSVLTEREYEVNSKVRRSR
ncbi:MAG: hypothetical protein QOG01_1378 [Pseudonocardiales bacterium]|jgi:hypothetical protein|nr:hypothetical protein [Pseudonocardiales bacterium]